ncbi:GNAT family N-acetyltransferase [Haloplanus sp. GCM10025708]|uniref:GNAT family N-acetyltransferase n=1 Tax=Haloferacaceae TaxID=1644056 RepID=UPI0036164B3E
METRRIEELSTGHVDDLHRLYQNEWWTETRDREELPQMLSSSDELFGIENADSRELVAFARVLTDYTYKALIFDFIVAEPHRNEGLGAQLMSEVLGEPRLADVEHFELYCLEEMTGFYAQWEFTEELGDLRLMRR